MAVARWYMAVGDRLPSFAATVRDDRGLVLDLTGSKAYMRLRRVDEAGLGDWYETEVSIIDYPGGLVAKDWDQAEVDRLMPGVFQLQIRVTNPESQTGDIIVPTDGQAELVVWGPGLGPNPGYGEGRYSAGPYGDPLRPVALYLLPYTGPVNPPLPIIGMKSWGDDLNNVLADLQQRVTHPTPAIVVKSTPPVAADFGLSTIPVDAVWIRKP